MSGQPTRPGLDEPYTRLRAKVQIGDGPDRRGEATVEILRERQRDVDATPVEVELANGETVTTFVRKQNATFAEFYHELERAEGALRQRLGLNGGE